jgi:hypothetical protein
VQIPGFKKTAKSTSLLRDLADSTSAPILPKALPPLAALVIAKSSFLRNLYRCFYSLLALALIIALFPYITDDGRVLIFRAGWFALLVIALVGIWFMYGRQCALIPQGTLAYENGFWCLWIGGIKTNNVICGEVLCWSWLIVLPLKNIHNDHRQFLLLANDALKPADQARLRTWLRACLKPKG